MILVSISGGKDSTALLIYAVNKYGNDNVKAFFIDTKWEHPINYEYIDELTDKLGVDLIRVSNDRYRDMLDLIWHKKIFPSAHRRFCTQEMKIRPMTEYLNKHYDEIDMMLIGIRRNESIDRRIRYAKFKSNAVYRYRDVYGYVKSRIKGKYLNIAIQMPLLDWREKDVISYIRSNGFEINPLYKTIGRVGCFPCLISEKSIRESLKFELGRKRFYAMVELEKKLRDKGYKSKIFPDESDKKVRRLLMRAKGWKTQKNLDDCRYE